MKKPAVFSLLLIVTAATMALAQGEEVTIQIDDVAFEQLREPDPIFNLSESVPMLYNGVVIKSGLEGGLC